MTRKTETSVTLARGGMHSAARYKTAKKMILENNYKKARLYHFVLKNSTSQADYSKAADGITRLLRNNDIPCTGKGCWEVNEERGLHFHFMVLLDAGAGGKADHWLNVAEDGPLKTMLNSLKGLEGVKEDPEGNKHIKVHVAPPQNAMHRTTAGKMPLYQYVTKSGPKLEDALVRISYLYKKDSKDDSMKRIYYSTREKAKKEEALPVEQTTTTINEQGQTMTMTLTDAVDAYFKGFYQRYTDKELSVHEIRKELSDSGIPRTIQQVKEDLARYGYDGYAEAHAGPRPLTLTELAAADEAKIKKTRQLAAQRPKQQGYEAGPSSIAGAIRRAQQEAAGA